MRILFLSITLVSITSVGHAADNSMAACSQIERSKIEMDLISQNIANVNTTRTPEGGHYIPRRLNCDGEICNVVSDSSSILRYDPDHEDANEDGYVPSPNIDLMTEMGAMIEATKRWEAAHAACEDQT